MTRLLHRLIDAAASRNPDAEAVRCGGDSLTYGELVGRAGAVARSLLDLGVRRHDRVAVLLGKGIDVPVAFYGALASGGALLPIDPKSPAEHVVRILRATGARHLLTESKRVPGVEELRDDVPEVAHVLDVADMTSEGPARGLPDVPVLDLDTSYILHTSGSTGVPKLIRHTHATATSFVDWAAAEYGLRADDRLSNHSSHHTCFATFDFYAAARAGAAVVVLKPAVLKMPGSLSSLMERERLTVWYSVPTALVQLSLRGLLEERDLGALRWLLFAGETFPHKHLRRLRRQLPGARFSHVYGSTEINVVSCYHLPARPKEELPSPLPIGRTCANTVAEVVDADLEPVPDGTEGELIVRGSTVMSGYWDDEARNREVFVRRPSGGGFDDVFFRTGDRVRRLADGALAGQLAFVTRADDQIKVRGHRVELGEVESALLSVAGVEEAAAFSVPDGEGSRALRAVATLGPKAAPDLDLVAELRRRLPAYAVPERVAVIDALPRTATGKVDRRLLRARCESEEPVHG